MYSSMHLVREGSVWKGGLPPVTATEAGGTHPTGMHSCCECEDRRFFYLSELVIESSLPWGLRPVCSRRKHENFIFFWNAKSLPNMLLFGNSMCRQRSKNIFDFPFTLAHFRNFRRTHNGCDCLPSNLAGMHKHCRDNSGGYIPIFSKKSTAKTLKEFVL